MLLIWSQRFKPINYSSIVKWNCENMLRVVLCLGCPSSTMAVADVTDVVVGDDVTCLLVLWFSGVALVAVECEIGVDVVVLWTVVEGVVVVMGVVVEVVAGTSCVGALASRAELSFFSRGYDPRPQKLPLKSSMSRDQTIQPPYPPRFSQSTWGVTEQTMWRPVYTSNCVPIPIRL